MYQPARILAFSASNSSWVKTPASNSLPKPASSISTTSAFEALGRLRVPDQPSVGLGPGEGLGGRAEKGRSADRQHRPVDVVTHWVPQSFADGVAREREVVLGGLLLCALLRAPCPRARWRRFGPGPAARHVRWWARSSRQVAIPTLPGAQIADQREQGPHLTAGYRKWNPSMKSPPRSRPSRRTVIRL